jgi:hypothetical protein
LGCFKLVYGASTEDSATFLILFLKFFFDYFSLFFHMEINSVELDMKCANLSCLNPSMACINLLVLSRLTPLRTDGSDSILSSFNLDNPAGKVSFPSVVFL